MAFDSLFIGVTGLTAYQQQIDVISNNIANTGTTGYKAQDVTFQDLLYQNNTFASAPTQTNGGVNGQSVGNGVRIGTIDTDFTQGGLQTTGVNTDLAINGNGFFVLNNTQGTGTPAYTRDGAFSLNENGLLYDPSSGLAVMGFPIGANGQGSQIAPPAPIQIPFGLKSTAVATGAATAQHVGPQGDQVFDMTFGGNLNQADYVTAVSSNGATVNMTTISTTVYDSLGDTHLVNITFLPAATNNSATFGTITAAQLQGATLGGAPPLLVTNASGTQVTAATEWAYIISPTDGSDLGAGAGKAVVGGFMYFDQNGQYINTSTASGSVANPFTAANNTHVSGKPPSGGTIGGVAAGTGDQVAVTTWNNPNANNSSTTGNGLPGNAIGLDFSDMTALASTPTANTVSQNGYAPGLLSNITIAADGTVNGDFTNGQITAIAKVALATFQNEDGLTRVGSNQFTASANSGVPQYGFAGSGSLGSIVSGALEQSNVSIADEFTKMILAQRSFEANSRSITTADQDLQTVIALKSGTGG
jgi:flagellar hook protein FlgE